jgi:uncharacterized phage-associated protein
LPKTVVQFDRDKFKEAVWLVASYCPPQELGNVKLHKILYFADMLYFLREGRPLTGVDYIKQKFGPVARHLSAAVAELVSNGILKVTEQEYFGLYKKSYIPLIEYKQNRLSPAEITLLEEVADFVRGKSAKEISEFSHNAVWEAAQLGESLPYYTALRLVPAEFTDSDRTWARDSAHQYASERPQ